MKQLRFACMLLILASASDAAAQIDERDRLQRCENNRAQMLAIQAQWPSGARGWSDEQLARARSAMPALRILHDRQYRLTEPDQSQARMRVIGEMAQLAGQFGIVCFPFAAECASTYLDGMERGIGEAERGAPQRAELLRRFNTYRSNYIALDCLESASVAASSSDLGFATMTGTFDSSFGTLTLSTGGGSYDYYGGQVRVTGISGNVMEGVWTQTRAGRQCPDGRYHGRFRFTFSATGFTGSFGYCDEEPGAGVWNGTRR